ncbi:hypothetical protein TNCV_5004961 [Trichonephila clavipes]|uniref:Reverse transcriptase domain-containing protein n=1 Tax=Trichonephila clavipes TaxID=2585209 RepID=A0A8X6RGA6_TRICX|nr:hypothetical protein TNCV_5004961 [Trichonephila clavipes]
MSEMGIASGHRAKLSIQCITSVLSVFSSIVRDFLELFYNLWRTVLVKNKIVLDPALRLQSFRTPENATIGVRSGIQNNFIPRRLPFAKQEEVGTLLREMQENDIIEPSSSPWASPIVLVRKKDGSTRFCVDYRKLNDVTKKDSYPLPRIDDTLDTLSGHKWFSTLDLKSGYWQVEIHPEDREKTAFTSGQRLWQFKVMPFGLCNAPATFERLMETVLKGLTF